jgi:hypothetical protein
MIVLGDPTGAEEEDYQGQLAYFPRPPFGPVRKFDRLYGSIFDVVGGSRAILTIFMSAEQQSEVSIVLNFLDNRGPITLSDITCSTKHGELVVTTTKGSGYFTSLSLKLSMDRQIQPGIVSAVGPSPGVYPGS